MNEAMKAGKELVANIRDLAREVLRARWISNVLQAVMILNNDISSYNKSIEDCNKELARINYRISKLDQADPDYADKLKASNESAKYFNDNIEDHKKVIEKKNADIATEMAKITQIEAGELKVNAENLEVKAKELIEAYYSQKVTEITK